jgi:hypothetical protein
MTVDPQPTPATRDEVRAIRDRITTLGLAGVFTYAPCKPTSTYIREMNEALDAIQTARAVA